MLYGEGLKMETKEEVKLGHNAKRETEDFINRHLSNRAKGWPKLYLCQTVCTDSPQQQAVTHNGY